MKLNIVNNKLFCALGISWLHKDFGNDYKIVPLKTYAPSGIYIGSLEDEYLERIRN